MRVAVLVLMLVSGCIKDSLERCGDQLCPHSDVCINDACVPADSVAQCAGMPDGQLCTTQLFGAGRCVNGVCTRPGCGNGALDDGEVCDDGNRADGDGCSADCASIDVCPPIGSTPVYTHELTQIAQLTCYDISVSVTTNFMVGDCLVNGASTKMQGVVGQPLAPISELASPPTNIVYEHPHLTPEGDELWVIELNLSSGAGRLLAFHNDGNLGWVNPTPIDIVLPAATFFGHPSRGPARRFMVLDYNNDKLDEYLLDDNYVPVDVRTMSTADLGVTGVYQGPDMSGDALRIVFSGSVNGMPLDLYADRSDISSPFGPARPVLDLGATNTLFMTDNCQWMYFSGFGAVFAVAQIGSR